MTGRAVTNEQLTAIVAAARSCPMLTPARIAGQLMAESGLDNRAQKTASGGRGIAGLDDDDWKAWKPWPDAQRSDSCREHPRAGPPDVRPQWPAPAGQRLR